MSIYINCYNSGVFTMLDWINNNKEWLFDGIGVLFVSFILAIIGKFLFTEKGKSLGMRHTKQIQNSGNNSTNIQSGKDITINLSSKEDK